MPTFPAKTNYAAGDVLTAAQMVDVGNGLNDLLPDAKGSLTTVSAANTPAQITVGADGTTLVADSSTSTGLRWNPSVEAGKNRIINGQMVIDQRNAGAAVTVNTAANTYALDRWRGFGQATDGVFTIQQDSSAPSGFSKSAKITVTTADASIGSTQIYNFSQGIEGYNIVDFGFGSAGAKTVTLSFWVRSSLTGTFGGSLRNNSVDRSYPFSYSISAADTWEKKSVTISGDTTGTWQTDNATGIILGFSLGAGTDRLETAGSWYGSNRLGATGQVQVIGTLNATWYVTGVQLELGSVATSFSNAGGTFAGELAACQRYYQVLTGNSLTGYNSSTNTAMTISHTPMRTSSITYGLTNTLRITDVGTGDFTQSSANITTNINLGETGALLTFGNFTGLTAYRSYSMSGLGKITASAEL